LKVSQESFLASVTHEKYQSSGSSSLRSYWKKDLRQEEAEAGSIAIAFVSALLCHWRG
jgi:hypothetical protein